MSCQCFFLPNGQIAVLCEACRRRQCREQAKRVTNGCQSPLRKSLNVIRRSKPHEL